MSRGAYRRRCPRTALYHKLECVVRGDKLYVVKTSRGDVSCFCTSSPTVAHSMSAPGAGSPSAPRFRARYRGARLGLELGRPFLVLGRLWRCAAVKLSHLPAKACTRTSHQVGDTCGACARLSPVTESRHPPACSVGSPWSSFSALDI
jgi:hypothetical protein